MDASIKGSSVMKVVVAEDYEDLSRRAAVWLLIAMANTNNPTVILPTGNTPLGLYRNLAANPKRKLLETAKFIQLDEYQGIARNDSRTLGSWFRHVFMEPLSIDSTALCSFDSSSHDPDQEAARVDRFAIQSGIDICVLGLGQNGHLGFNELTERKRAEEQQCEAQAQLAHVTRVTTLGEMTASIAHEIN